MAKTTKHPAPAPFCMACGKPGHGAATCGGSKLVLLSASDRALLVRCAKLALEMGNDEPGTAASLGLDVGEDDHDKEQAIKTQLDLLVWALER